MLDSITSALSGIAEFGRSLGEFTHGLNEQSTWLRVVFVILGLALIAIALWSVRPT